MTSRALWQAHSSVFHRFIKPLLNFINTKFLEDPFLDVNGAAALALPLTCPRPRPALASGSCTSPPPPPSISSSSGVVGSSCSSDHGRRRAHLGWAGHLAAVGGRMGAGWAAARWGGGWSAAASAWRQPTDRVVAVPWRWAAARARCGRMRMRSTNWDFGTGDQIWAFTGLD